MDAYLPPIPHSGEQDALRRQNETGGLSAPIAAAERMVVAQVAEKVGWRIPVVSAGGIMCPRRQTPLDMGAALVQVFYRAWSMPDRAGTKNHPGSLLPGSYLINSEIWKTGIL